MFQGVNPNLHIIIGMFNVSGVNLNNLHIIIGMFNVSGVNPNLRIIIGMFNVSGVNPNLHIIIGMFNVSGVPIWPGRTRPGAVQDQAGPHLLQAPPAQDHEGPLPDQPEPRLQGAQDVVTEDWSRQKGSAGERG